MAAAASHIHGHWHEQSGFQVPQSALIPDVQWPGLGVGTCRSFTVATRYINDGS